MIIRHAHPDDLSRINAVDAAFGRSPWDSRALDGNPDRCVAVAVADNTVVGAGKTHHQLDAVVPAPAGFYLGGVSVDPGHRRRGIGHALTQARIDRLWQRSDTGVDDARKVGRCDV